MAHCGLGRGGRAIPVRGPGGEHWVSLTGTGLLPPCGVSLTPLSVPQVFSLPPSVLRFSAQEPAGTEGAYKAAVDSFLQQQHVLGADVERERQHCSQDPHSHTGPPTTTQTQALSGLFDSVKTLTAKEELLQTLR